MQNGNVPAAVAALQVLAQIATRTQLFGFNADRSPLLAALNYPNLRVQFAAAVTIMQLDPNRDFPGAERVVDVLTRALGNSGGPAVLVIDSNSGRANTVAGLFQQLGYRGQPITMLTGQAGFQAAVKRNDVELIAIQANVTEWTLSQTLANFRTDARTANVPILIYGPDWAEANVKKLIDRTPLTGFIKESFTLDFFRNQVEPILERMSAKPLSEAERAAQASAGAYWLAHIARTRRTKIFDLASAETALGGSVENPNLAQNALVALGGIPTKTAQQRLEGVVVSIAQEEPLRELAAIQLAFHIQRHGLLLTSDQVREVKAAAAKATSPPLSSALTSVLGSLKPNPQAVGIQLQQFPIKNPLSP